MAETQEVAIRFTEPTAFGDYSDVLFYPFATFGSVTRARINADKAARVNAWIAIVTNPPVMQQPSRAEQLRYLEELRRNVANEEERLNTHHGERTEPELRAHIEMLRAELLSEEARYQRLYGG